MEGCLLSLGGGPITIASFRRGQASPKLDASDDRRGTLGGRAGHGRREGDKAATNTQGSPRRHGMRWDVPGPGRAYISATNKVL